MSLLILRLQALLHPYLYLMNKKITHYLLGVLGLLLLIVVTLVFSQRVRDLSRSPVSEPKAAAEVTFALVPSTATILPGGTQKIAITANVTESSVSSFNVRLSLPSGTVTPSNLALNPTLAGSGLWTFPIQGITGPVNNLYTISVSAISTDINGAPAGNYTLATFDLLAGSTPNNTPIAVTFDPSITKAVPKNSTTPLPIASLINGSYLVSSPSPTPTPIPPTPTPTQIPPTPTRTPTPTLVPPTPTRTPTPTLIPPTPTPTTVPPTPTRTPTPVPTLTPTPAPKLLNLTLRLQGINSPKTPSQATTVKLIQNNVIVGTFTGSAANTNNPAGLYTLNLTSATFTSGTYDLLIKTNTTLQRRFSAITLNFTANGATVDLSATELLTGDVDNNNKITIEDISAINVLYQGSFSVPTFPGQPADLNQDNTITIGDLALALLNYQDFTISGDLDP